MTTSPFATTSPATDSTLEFDDPTTEFVTIDDLDGRTICVFAKESQIAESTKPGGKPYPKVIADVIVLDGPVTDKIAELPMLVPDMHLSATAVVASVKPGVRTKRPIMGKVDSRPSQYNRQVKAYGLQQVDQDTKNRFAPAVRQALAQGIDG